MYEQIDLFNVANYTAPTKTSHPDDIDLEGEEEISGPQFKVGDLVQFKPHGDKVFEIKRFTTFGWADIVSIDGELKTISPLKQLSYAPIEAECSGADAVFKKLEVAPGQTVESGLECSGADFKQANLIAPEHKHWTEIYSVERRGRRHYYYRYVWMEGRKLHHIHIAGGSVKSAIAQSRKLEVESAIASGQSPVQIQQLIQTFKSGI